MNLFLILIAGFPGTGKSYLCKRILKRYSGIRLISPDEIKEEYWDRYGYDTLEEKNACIKKSWAAYYRRVETAFGEGVSVLSDYPFSDKQKPRLAQIANFYNVGALTVRLTANLEVLFFRQQRRDLDESRHLGHILNHSYHKGREPERREAADALLSREEFLTRCETRGYGTFALGDCVELDVSDFAAADYERVMRFLSERLEPI